MAQPVFNWTGFYVGGNVGGAWGQSSVNEPAAIYGATTFTNNLSGIIGGFQAGYNWQAGNLVYGLETDIAFTSAKRDTDIFAGFVFHRSSLTALGTFRGRVGVAMGPTLLYATGGAAYAWLKHEFTDNGFPFTASRSSPSWGWTAGGGIEHAFGNNWSAKIEYLYAHFPNQTVTDPTSGYTFTFRDSVSVVRTGINFRF